MNNEDKIIDFLNGELTYDEASAFETQISKDSELKAQVESYKILYGNIDDMPMEKPSITLQSNFNHLLAQEMKKTAGSKATLTLKKWRNVAAVAAVLVIGILVGQNWTQRSIIDNQTSALVSEMKRNMNSESVTGRIEAMQVSQQINTPENEVLKTLISTLKNDSSPNVRLAAAEALDKFAKEEKVRSAFVSQLSVEQDPFVLIALINTLSEQKVEKAIDPLQNLTTAEDVAKFIKDEAHLGLIKIEKI